MHFEQKETKETKETKNSKGAPLASQCGEAEIEDGKDVEGGKDAPQLKLSKMRVSDVVDWNRYYYG